MVKKYGFLDRMPDGRMMLGFHDTALLARWNSATNPHMIMGEWEMKRSKDYARALNNRIKLCGIRYRELSNGARIPAESPMPIYADGFKDYSGMAATIETSGKYSLPWAIRLDDGRTIAECGSYATARRQFSRMGLRIV